MKRDLPFIYSILNTIAVSDKPFCISEEKLETNANHKYNIELAINEGLVREVTISDCELPPSGRLLTLTWKGHRFIDVFETYIVESEKGH